MSTTTTHQIIPAAPGTTAIFIEADFSARPPHHLRVAVWRRAVIAWAVDETWTTPVCPGERIDPDDWHGRTSCRFLMIDGVLHEADGRPAMDVDGAPMTVGHAISEVRAMMMDRITPA